MTAKPRKVSWSMFKAWATCPLFWRLSYVDDVAPREESIHGIFGSAIHDTIQMWLNVLFNESKLRASTIDLTEHFKERLFHHFRANIKEVDGQKVFVCDKDMLMGFYRDGLAILSCLQSHASEYFDPTTWTLEGVEVAIELELRPNVPFIGYLDVVLRHKLTGAVKIVDLKTSTRGWNKFKKADKLTTNQLLLYKAKYAEKLKLPHDAIGVEYLVLKRKLDEHSDYPQKRILRFEPSQGSISMKKVIYDFNQFVEKCFSADGNYVIEGVKATPSRDSCKFCPFSTQPQYCAQPYKE